MDSSDDLALLGLDPDRWRRAGGLAQRLTTTPGAAIVFQVVRPDVRSRPVACGTVLASRDNATPGPTGSTSLAATRPAASDDLFLTASLSKPLVAMGVLALVEAGQLSLQERVQEILPECDAAPKRSITVRHLLTHTSGLPDMLPNNRPLRVSQAPLSAFVRGTCGVTLDFPPGRGVQYQSMGYALLGEIVARVTGKTCAAYLRETIFDPLGMSDTALGAPPEWFFSDTPSAPSPSVREARFAPVLVPADQQGGDNWNWNSRYWRGLGAPWGGVLSTVDDLSTFLQMMLGQGRRGDCRLFAPGTVAAATSNQLAPLHDLPEADRRTRGWGYGWRLNWTGHAATFGDLLPPSTYGHWGATGTLWWVDPQRQVGLVLLSTLPLERDRFELLRLSNAIAAAL